MRPGKPLFLAAPLAALAIAGCGGGGDDDSTASTAAPVETTPTLSKQDLIAQGDAICAEVNAAVGTITANESEATGVTVRVADVYAGMVDDLEGLGEPDDKAGYDQLIEAAKALSAAEGEAKLADEREDPAALEAAQANVATALSGFQSAAAAYGFEACAEEPSAPTVVPDPGAEASEGEEEVAPEGEIVPEEEAAPEEEVEEAAPETGGAGGGAVAPETGGGAETGGGSGGVGPG